MPGSCARQSISRTFFPSAQQCSFDGPAVRAGCGVCPCWPRTLVVVIFRFVNKTTKRRGCKQILKVLPRRLHSFGLSSIIDHISLVLNADLAHAGVRPRALSL
jgi:hypothetical protein